MRQRETLKREYYGEQDGEIWVANMSKYTRWDEGYEGPYCELYIDPTGTSVLKSYTDLAEPIPYMVFEILKGIENPHLVKLQRRFYCRFKDADIEKLQTRPTLVPIDAYSRKNIREQRIEILKRDKDYLLQNIAELQALFDDFSQRRISANFRRKDDVRVDSNGIIIMNPDAFIMSDDEKLSFYNKLTLLTAVRALMIEEYSLQLFHPNAADANKAIIDLLDSHIAYESDMAASVAQKLEGFKKPIQYVKKHM